MKSESANLKSVKLPEALKKLADLEKKHASALAPLEQFRREHASAREQLQRWQAAQDSEKRRMAAR
ncbi:MAG: hypothetical protein HC841_07550 [Verrucomicrobiae bacterium]|nr:hypothetical protein [Verrucomicrobiae bacterium]